MELTLSVSEFKAKCLDIIKRLGDHRLERVTVTRRGAPVAIVTPPPSEHAGVDHLFGAMKGTIWIDPEVDLTAPIFDGEMDAEKGILYR